MSISQQSTKQGYGIPRRDTRPQYLAGRKHGYETAETKVTLKLW